MHNLFIRESETQTDPYTPDYVVPAGMEPEVLDIHDWKYGDKLPAGMEQMLTIDRMREKRKFEDALPPTSDEVFRIVEFDIFCRLRLVFEED